MEPFGERLHRTAVGLVADRPLLVRRDRPAVLPPQIGDEDDVRLLGDARERQGGLPAGAEQRFVAPDGALQTPLAAKGDDMLERLGQRLAHLHGGLPEKIRAVDVFRPLRVRQLAVLEGHAAVQDAALAQPLRVAAQKALQRRRAGLAAADMDEELQLRFRRHEVVWPGQLLKISAS
jgi:hypothetical protein